VTKYEALIAAAERTGVPVPGGFPQYV